MSGGPFARKFKGLLPIDVAAFLFSPKTELAITASQNNSPRKWTNCRNKHLLIWQLIEDVMVFLLDFVETRPDLFEH